MNTSGFSKKVHGSPPNDIFSRLQARLQLAYCRLLSNAPRAAAILEGLLASKASLPRSQYLDVQKFVGWLTNLPGMVSGGVHPMIGGKVEDFWGVLLQVPCFFGGFAHVFFEGGECERRK